MPDKRAQDSELICPPDCPIMHNRRHYDDQLASVQRDVKQLQTQHATISADMRVLQHVVEEHTANSLQWHEQHNAEMTEFRKDLKAHMEDEPESMALLLAPVIQRLDNTNDHIKEVKHDISGLYARWWQLAVALIALLLAVVGSLYLENQSHTKEVIARIEMERGK